MPRFPWDRDISRVLSLSSYLRYQAGLLRESEAEAAADPGYELDRIRALHLDKLARSISAITGRMARRYERESAARGR